MFRFTLAIAVLIAVSLDSRAKADQDLDALVESLSFGDSNQKLMSSSLMPEMPHNEELAPAPGQQLAAPGQQLASAQDHAIDYGIEIPPDSLTPSDAPALPRPIVEASPAPPAVNFNHYFAAGGMGDACVGGSPALYSDAPVVGRPHHAPNLPPPSSMLQYYQSDNCYSDVWNGYAAERQKRCDHLHKHIHGTCDCFTKGKSHCGCKKHCGCGHAH